MKPAGEPRGEMPSEDSPSSVGISMSSFEMDSRPTSFESEG